MQRPTSQHNHGRGPPARTTRPPPRATRTLPRATRTAPPTRCLQKTNTTYQHERLRVSYADLSPHCKLPVPVHHQDEGNDITYNVANNHNCKQQQPTCVHSLLTQPFRIHVRRRPPASPSGHSIPTGTVRVALSWVEQGLPATSSGTRSVRPLSTSVAGGPGRTVQGVQQSCTSAACSALSTTRCHLLQSCTSGPTAPATLGQSLARLSLPSLLRIVVPSVIQCIRSAVIRFIRIDKTICDV